MILKSVLLRLPPEEAFRLFTERISAWWPDSHRPSKDPASELFLKAGGRFWEKARDGREFELGHVVSWEPPHRLTVDFYIGTNAAQPTALEVIFAVRSQDPIPPRTRLTRPEAHPCRSASPSASSRPYSPAARSPRPR